MLANRKFWFTVYKDHIVLHWLAVCDRPMTHHLTVRKSVLKVLIRQLSDLLDP